jgi:hypothetical protein
MTTPKHTLEEYEAHRTKPVAHIDPPISASGGLIVGTSHLITINIAPEEQIKWKIIAPPGNPISPTAKEFSSGTSPVVLFKPEEEGKYFLVCEFSLDPTKTQSRFSAFAIENFVDFLSIELFCVSDSGISSFGAGLYGNTTNTKRDLSRIVQKKQKLVTKTQFLNGDSLSRSKKAVDIDLISAPEADRERMFVTMVDEHQRPRSQLSDGAIAAIFSGMAVLLIVTFSVGIGMYATTKQEDDKSSSFSYP